MTRLPVEGRAGNLLLAPMGGRRYFCPRFADAQLEIVDLQRVRKLSP